METPNINRESGPSRCAQCQELEQKCRAGREQVLRYADAVRLEVDPAFHKALVLEASSPGGPEGASWLYHCQDCGARWDCCAWVDYGGNDLGSFVQPVTVASAELWLSKKHAPLIPPKEGKGTWDYVVTFLGVLSGLLAAALWFSLR